MSAAYDTYDYVSYWEGREYEHRSEVIAVSAFLQKIKSVKSILDIGGGYGRLVPTYIFRAKKVILSDPSSKLLKIAREKYKDKLNLKFIHSSLDTLVSKISKNSIDLIIMVRVVHHINDLDSTFSIIKKMLKKRGYLILEFANKEHLKARLSAISRGNYAFLKETQPTDIRSQRHVKMGTLPFINYHPETIVKLLNKYNFEIIEKRSVSNIRSPLMKQLFPVDLLLWFENLLQKPLSKINFGPSIFILARKRG